MGILSKLAAALSDDDLTRHGLTPADLGPADSQGRLRNANTVLTERAAAKAAAAAAKAAAAAAKATSAAKAKGR